MKTINVKTNRFDYTVTFNNNTMSMTSTHKNPNVNFENISIPSTEKAINRFKFFLKMRNENIIEWNETTY